MNWNQFSGYATNKIKNIEIIMVIKVTKNILG